jgi:hypothetical protein
VKKGLLDNIPIVYEGVNCPYCANPNEQARPVTREVANQQLHCPDPSCACTTVELLPECHPDSGSRVFYCRVHGTLAVFCDECRGLQSAFQIASGNTSARKRRRKT